MVAAADARAAVATALGRDRATVDHNLTGRAVFAAAADACAAVEAACGCDGAAIDRDLTARALSTAADARAEPAACGGDRTAADGDSAAVFSLGAADAGDVIVRFGNNQRTGAQGRFCGTWRSIGRVLTVDGEAVARLDVHALGGRESAAVHEDDLHVAGNGDALGNHHIAADHIPAAFQGGLVGKQRVILTNFIGVRFVRGIQIGNWARRAAPDTEVVFVTAVGVAAF